MSSSRTVSGRPQRPTGAAPAKGAKATSTTSKSTSRQTVPAKKKEATTTRTTTAKSVRLDEIDPNSGPLDVAQKVILYGQGIDTSRMKVKFGSQPAVFLQSVATASGHKVTCVVPPVPRSKSGGRVAVHLVSILDERKVLNPNDHVHYRYSPKTLLDSDTLLSVSHVFSVIDTMTQREKEFFAAAFHRQSNGNQTPPALESRKQCLTLMKKVSTELSILGRSTQSQSLASLRASSSAESQDLFADIDKKLERDRKSKQVSDALADFLPEVAADFRRVQSGDTTKPSARQEQVSSPIATEMEEPVAVAVPVEEVDEESDSTASKRVNFRDTLEHVPAVSDRMPLSPASEGPHTMIPAAMDEPDRELKDRLDSFSDVSADEVDMKHKRAAQSEHLPGMDPPLSSAFDEEDTNVDAVETEPPKEADLIHPEVDDAVVTVSDEEEPAPLDEVALKEEEEQAEEEAGDEDLPENDDEATSAEVAPSAVPVDDHKSDSEDDAEQQQADQQLSEEEQDEDDDESLPPPPEDIDEQTSSEEQDQEQEEQEQEQDQDASEETLDVAEPEHHLQTVPLDEEAMRERSERSERSEEEAKSASREAVFEEDFDATPQREQPLGDILRGSDAPEEPVHQVQFADGDEASHSEEEHSGPRISISSVPLDEVALRDENSASEHQARSVQFEEEDSEPTADDVIIEQYIANNHESSVEVHFDDAEPSDDAEQQVEAEEAPQEALSEEEEQAEEAGDEEEAGADEEEPAQTESQADPEPVVDEDQAGSEDDAQESEHAEEAEEEVEEEAAELSEQDKSHQLEDTPLDEVALHNEEQSHSTETPVFEENFDEPIREPVLGEILAGDKSDDQANTHSVHFSEDVSDPAEEHSDSTDSKPRHLLGLSHLDVSDSENDPEFPASLDGNRGSDWDSASLHPEDPFKEDDTAEIPIMNEDQPLDETVLESGVEDVEPPVSQVNVSLNSDHSTWTVDLDRKEELDVPLVDEAPPTEEGTTLEVNDPFDEDSQNSTQSSKKPKSLDLDDDMFAGFSAPARTTNTSKKPPVDFDDIFG